jgi:hypothetical protein
MGDFDTPFLVKVVAALGTVAVLVWMVLWAVAEFGPAL